MLLLDWWCWEAHLSKQMLLQHSKWNCFIQKIRKITYVVFVSLKTICQWTGISCFLVVLPTRSKVSTQGCSSTPNTYCLANGTGVFYDPTRFICCEGKLNRRDDPNKLYCCGQILYSPASSICCNNVLTNFKTAYLRLSCCRGVGYDADKFLCCQGRVTKKTFDNPGCCAGKELDNTRQICCQGKIQPSTEGMLHYFSFIC